jgi:histidinol-phosphate aminotransferase
MEKEKKRYYNTFDELGINYVRSHTNFILFDTGKDAQTLFGEILKRGVIVRPCTGFGLPTSIRVTIGTPDENNVFLSVLKEVLTQ